MSAAEYSTITPFRDRVYACLKTVPAGRVTTYKLLAAAVGCGSVRAIGQAMRRNPFAPEVPCHRVIRSDLTIGGFKGETAGAAIARKRQLLAAEGVFFECGRLADASRVMKPSPAQLRLESRRSLCQIEAS